MAQFPPTTHRQHAGINEEKINNNAQYSLSKGKWQKKAETTERLHFHSFPVIFTPLIFAPLKGMTEHTDAYVNISTASLTRSPTLLFLLRVLNH